MRYYIVYINARNKDDIHILVDPFIVLYSFHLFMEKKFIKLDFVWKWYANLGENVLQNPQDTNLVFSVFKDIHKESLRIFLN